MIAFTLSVTACSGVDVKEAATLATAGESAATTLHDEAAATREQFSRVPNRYAVYRRLALGATAAPGEVFTPEDITDTVGNQDQMIIDQSKHLTDILRSREKMFDDLIDTYRGFQALAEYDSVGETRAAFDKFAASANGFISAVSAVSAGAAGLVVPPFVIPVARGVVTIAAEENHKHQIVKASEQIREALAKVQTALEGEKEYAVAVRQGLVQDAASLRETLYEAGLAKEDLTSLATEAASLADTAVASNASTVIKSNPNIAAALKSYRNFKEANELADMEVAYDTSLKVFDQLIAQHKQLEEGKPFDLERLNALVVRLASIYEEARAATAAAKEANQ